MSEDVDFRKEVSNVIKSGDLEKVKLLLGNSNEKLNIKTPTGNLLNVAATYNQLDIVKYLLEMGIDTNVECRNGNALTGAAGNNNFQMVKLLREYGVKLECFSDKRNPMMYVIGNSYFEMFQYLLSEEKKLLDADEYEKLKEYILEYAKALNNKKIVDYLQDRDSENEKEGAVDLSEIVVSNNTDKKNKLQNENEFCPNELKRILRMELMTILPDLMELYKGNHIYIISWEIDSGNNNCYVYVNTKEHYDAAIHDEEEEKWYDYFCENEFDIIENSPEYYKNTSKYIRQFSDINAEEIYRIYSETIFELKKEGLMERYGMSDIIFAVDAYEDCNKKEIIEMFQRMNNEQNTRIFEEHYEDFA